MTGLDLNGAYLRGSSPTLAQHAGLGAAKRKRDEGTPSGSESRGAPSPAPVAVAPSSKSVSAKGKGKAKAAPKVAKGASKKQTKKGASAGHRRARGRAADFDYSLSPEPEADSLQPPTAADASDEEADDRLYCICQQTYNPERMMIACDRCDEWYHLDCIHVAEADVELIKDFVCPRCQEISDARTSWKARCARPACHKPAVSLSKYCSDYCGIEVAASRLESVHLEGGPARYWPVVAHVRKPISLVQRAGSSAPSSPGIDSIGHSINTLQTQLAVLAGKRAGAEAHVALVEARMRFLALAVRRWEGLRRRAMAEAALQPLSAADVELDHSAGQKKGKGKRAAKSKSKAPPEPDDADAPCGFDVRLVWDDRDWEPWVASNELDREEARPTSEVDDQVVCLLVRRQCDRHSGWQRLHEASFQAEKSGQLNKLDRLAAQERNIRLRLDEISEERRREIKTPSVSGHLLASQEGPIGPEGKPVIELSTF